MKSYYTKETVTKKLNTMREVVVAYQTEIEEDLMKGDECESYPNIENVGDHLKEIDPAIFELHCKEDGLIEFVRDYLLNEGQFEDFRDEIEDGYINRIIECANHIPVYHEEIDFDKFTEALPEHNYDENHIVTIVETFIVEDNERIAVSYLLFDDNGIVHQVNTEGCCNVGSIDLVILKTIMERN